MGGATYVYVIATDQFYGLSPRGRGNLLAFLIAAAALGSIPAWAGQPP